MTALSQTAPAFIENGPPHRVVYCGRELLRNGPEPVGYDPAMLSIWDGPTSERFAVLRLDPWRMRVFPGTVLLEQRGEVLTWSE
jgi:hypothetical protein